MAGSLSAESTYQETADFFEPIVAKVMWIIGMGEDHVNYLIVKQA